MHCSRLSVAIGLIFDGSRRSADQQLASSIVSAISLSVIRKANEWIFCLGRQLYNSKRFGRGSSLIEDKHPPR